MPSTSNEPLTATGGAIRDVSGCRPTCRALAAPLFALALACATTSTGCSPAPPQSQSVEPAKDAAVLAPPEPGHGRAEQVGGSGVQLAGHRLDVAPNDWVLRDGTYEALISSRRGRVIALGRRGAPNGLVSWRPEVFEGLGALDMAVERVSADEDGRLLHIVKSGQTRPFTLHTWLRLDGPVLTMRSQLVAHERPVMVTLGETVFWGNAPTWVQGHGFIGSGGSFGGRFIARDALGVAYASCSHEGPLLARFSAAGLPGFHRSARTGERLIRVEPKQASAPRTVSIAISDRSLGDAAAALPCAPASTTVATGNTGSATQIEIAQCEPEDERRARRARHAFAHRKAPADAPPLKPAVGRPLTRLSLDGRRGLPLPAEGCLRARLLAGGHAPGAWFDPRRRDAEGWGGGKAIWPKAGTLKWEIRDEGGAPLPAKLVVRGVGDTPWPDWGEDPIRGAARNFVYTLADGRAPIPPGEHEVIITRGPEYGIHRQRVRLRDGEAVSVEATLKRSLDTRGWISADLHVHALPSFDAPALLADRIRSLAGVNVEVAVATDHNAVTDYRPTIAALGLTQHMTGIVGDEVTVDELPLGHFNVFPLAPGSAPLPWRHTTPDQLFSTARQRSQNGIIQVNHPSMGSIGYLDLMHFDRRNAAQWRKRADMANLDFDAIEVFNGDHYANIGAVRDVMQEWFALLDAGVKSTATGNSDSHKVTYQEAGMPRNWIAVQNDDPRKLNPAELIDSIKRGRVIVSSGPFIRFSVGDAQIGGSVAPGEHEVRIEVSAAEWIDVSKVRLLLGGQVIRELKVEGRATPRLVHRERLRLNNGDWLIVEARGSASMPDLYRGRAKPFAFTNPVFVRYKFK